jgi:manganese oxidase
MHPSRTTFAIPALVFVFAIALSCAQMTNEASSTDRVTANDNRRPAGRLRGDTLEITLVARAARWFPEADSGPHLDVTAFAVQGRAPEIPSPLIRVRTGTTIRATVRNELADSTLEVFGLFTRPAAALDSIILGPGESRTLTFAAGAPGTYVYGAKVGTIDWDMRERETMVGAFVVDSLGDQPNDRVFVVNIWGETIDSVRYRNALAINGRAWPYTERFTVATGDTLRWRWVNGSVRPHPMHLHGFYFTVNARGTLLADTAIAPDERPVVVTNVMNPF